MKAKKFFGALLTCLGCIAAFVGLATTVLPMIQNDQLQLVLASFEAPSSHPLVSLMNSGVCYALRNCYTVMLGGAGVAVVGALLLLSAQSAAPRRENERRAARLGEAKPVSAAARSVAPPVTASTPIPAWRSTKAADVTEHNPYASPALGDLFAPKAAPFAPEKAGGQAASGYARPAEAARERAPARANPFAAARERSPYERPVGEAVAPVPSPASAMESEPACAPVTALEAAAEAPAMAGTAVEEAAGMQATAAALTPVTQMPPATTVTPATPATQIPPATPAMPMPPVPLVAQIPPVTPVTPVTPAMPMPPVTQISPVTPVTQATQMPPATPMPPAMPMPPATPKPPVSFAAAPAASAVKPKQVKIKSTMGKHTL